MIHGNVIEANFVLAFHCDETNKTYVAIDYQKQIFEKNSHYNNLDILEVSNVKVLYTSPDHDSINFKFFITTIELIGEILPIEEISQELTQ